MIDFQLPPEAQAARNLIHRFAGDFFRKLARKYDLPENEHQPVTELKSFRALMGGRGGGPRSAAKPAAESPAPGISRAGIVSVVSVEEMAWADAGLMLALPGEGIGQAAIRANGSPEQKAYWGQRMVAMAITEPGCGSDSSAVETTARLDEKTREWVINGQKIFITGGGQADAVVVWATLDKSKGKAAVKSLVVDKAAPGVTLVGLEKKMGIRASDTAAISFEDVRVPYENLLGSPEIGGDAGFKKTRKFFDLTRPGVAAIGVGVARAALDFTLETLAREGIVADCTRPPHEIGAVEKELLAMEAELEVARLLTWRAASLADEGLSNSLEASMAKAKSGKSANRVAQKCVELLGPRGYSCEWLAEKWMRDCKINDIYEGTGQIQMLIIARIILGFDREQLK